MTSLAPLADAEREIAHELWNQSVPGYALSAEHFASNLAGGDAWTACQSGAIVGVGVGALWPVPGETRGSLRMLAVAPHARRRGVATALTDRLADRLRQRGATVLRLGECAPVYLTPGVDERLEAGLAFARAAGFGEIGRSVHLGVDVARADWSTSDAEARLAEAGVRVRRAAESDREALGVTLDAHWPAWHPEAEIALARRTLHLAERDGTVVGFAAHSACNVEWGWFGPMGTAPAARGLGIGAVLLRRCLADLRAAGHDRATIAWAAALPFYERACGAQPSHRFQRFERRL